eukprot:gene6331-8717_t
MLVSFSRSRKAKIAISWYFGLCGGTMGNFSVLLAEIKQQRHLNNGILGVILISGIAGAIVALPAVSYLAEKVGSGNALFVSAIIFVLTLPIIAVPGNIGIFVAGMFCLGLSVACSDVTMNAQAVICEKMTRTPTLGLFHAMYAIGGICGALICGAMLQAQITPLYEVCIMSLIFFFPSCTFYYWLFSYKEEKFINSQSLLSDEYETARENKLSNEITTIDEATHPLKNGNIDKYEIISPMISSSTQQYNDFQSNMIYHNLENNNTQKDGINNDQSISNNSNNNNESEEWKVYASPESRSKDYDKNDSIDHNSPDYSILFLLCLLGLLAYLGEGSVSDWCAIYLRDNLNSSALVSSLGYVGFDVFVAIGRFYSDSIVVKIGRKRLLIASGAIGFVGFSIASLAPIAGPKVDIALAIIGFSLAGVGLSSIAPTVISMAGSAKTGMNSTDAIACVSGVGYLGLLIGPPMLGGFSVIFNGIRWSYMMVAGFMAIVSFITLFIKFENTISS